MQTWQSGTPLRETLREAARQADVTIDEGRLEEVFRPERYVARLGGVFDRLAALS
jgi:adenylosuccinate lyase